MESKIETLKSLVAEMFDKAEDKSVIEQLTAINKAADEVAEEHDKLSADYKELLTDYKEVITHTSFNDKANQPKDQLGGTPASFEDALRQFMENQK